MAEVLRAITLEARATHLDLLANGEKVLTEEKNKNVPIIIACIGLLAISGIVIYYELRLNKEEGN